MKIRKKHVWIIGIGLILLSIIAIFVWSMIPHYSKSLSLILRVENIESELVDNADGWIIDYEVYKLSDATVKNFLKKKNKRFYDKKGYRKLKWTRGPVDSLSYPGPVDSLSYRVAFNLLDYKKYVDTLMDRRRSDVFSYMRHMDSLNYMRYIDTLRNITTYSLSAADNNLKIREHVDMVCWLIYNNSYYAIHYINSNLFIVYTLDEKNNLLYITRYWL